ncbi:polysaccharide biosynthesis protein [Enhydrobacter aerosaccus SK60]|nr:polysaccharide biosynthesis protein [Enhydrobacter aerosaccus SK60]
MLNKIKRLTHSALLKDSLIYVVGEMTAKAVPFLLLPYLTRVLGTTGFGDLSYYLSLTAFIVIAMSLSQNGALTRYFYVYGRHGLGNILLAGGLYSVGVLLIGTAISWLLHSELLFYCFFTAFLQTLVQNQLALRQCQKRPFSYLTIQLGLALGNLLWTVMIFQFFAGDTTDKVAQRLIAIILAHGFTFVAALAWAKYQFAIKFRFTPKRLKLGLGYILTLGLPLLLHGLSYTIKGQLDRVLIHQRFSSHELGVYSAGVQVASSLTIVIMAVNSALVPHLYERLKSQRMTVVQLHRLFWLSLMVPVMLTAMAWAMPSSLMAWLLGADFAQSQYYVVMFVLAFSLIIPYLLLVNFLFYHAKSAQISLCSVISTVVYLLALWLLSGVSLAAVPYATIISSVVILPLLYYYTLQVEKDKKTP